MIAVAGRPLSASDVQKATGLPRPSCYRLIQTLLDLGLIGDPDGHGRYVIGERLIRIALLGKSDIDVRRAVASTIKSAAVRYGETAFLARLRNGIVEIIHVETPDDPARAHIHPGLGQRLLHACSSAKAIAAFAEPAFRQQIVDGLLTPFTERTKTDAGALLAELEDVTRLGFAECDQEIDIGVASVAAPIQIANLGAIFSVGLVGPARRLDGAARKEMGREMIALAEKVGRAIQLCNLPN